MEMNVSNQHAIQTRNKTFLIYNENFEECGVEKVKTKFIKLSHPMIL